MKHAIGGGVGKEALTSYRIRAAKIIHDQAAVHQEEMFAQAQDLIRHLSMMGKKGDADALNNAITHLRRMGGLDRPVVQEIRVGNPDGTAFHAFEMPEKDKLEE